MERDFWQISLDRSSEKRRSPFASDYGADSSDDFATEPRARKQPRVFEDQIDGFPVDLEHETDYMDVVEIFPISDSFSPESSNSDLISISMNGDNGSFLSADLSMRGSQNEESPICCYGTIVEENPIVKIERLGELVESRVEVSLRFAGHGVSVHHHNTQAYGGLLHQNLARPLMEIYAKHSISFFAFMSKAEEEVSKTRPKTPGRLCINLYGAKSDGKSIGDVLDQAGIFLQHPQVSDLTVPYFNPHYLVRPNGRHPVPVSEAQTTAASETSLKLSNNQQLKSNIFEALDCSAQGPSKYSQITPSVSIRTPLKPHQLKALSMMVEKEVGRIEGNEFQSLWHKVAQSDRGVSLKLSDRRYKNAITGSMQHAEPRLCFGGLLADDMGLGKTLTMLALIMSSAEHLRFKYESKLKHSRKETTLIITPLSLLISWAEQIEKHIHSQDIKWCIYHGPSRSKSTDFSAFDVVLTTYDTVVGATGEKRKASIKENGALESFDWHRIVLDEAHIIRNASSQRHRALLRLKAQHRWCLTGTPIYNQVQDLNALLKFLQVYPFDSLPYFNTHVAQPLKTNEEKGIQCLKKLFQCVALRRTKDAVKDELKLPARQTRLHVVQFSPQEHEMYRILRKSLSYIFQSPGTETDKNGPASGILPTITRLRRFCNHNLDLLSQEIRTLMEELGDVEKLAQALTNKIKICDVCSDELSNDCSENLTLQSFQCGHGACSRCVQGRSAMNQSCPLCFGLETSQSPSSEADSGQPREVYNLYQPSSKVLAMLENISAQQATEPGVKWSAGSKPLLPYEYYTDSSSVVFSSWTGMLDLVGIALQRKGLTFQRIDGRHTDSRRRSALQAFRSDACCTVLLASIGSAGVGLDLTAAAHVHLLEPQWSPMAEEQAIDRVHRMGQTRPVTITRYYVKDSIEEHVVLVQRKKHKLIAQSLDLEQDLDQTSLMECLKKHLEGA